MAYFSFEDRYGFYSQRQPDGFSFRFQFPQPADSIGWGLPLVVFRTFVIQFWILIAACGLAVRIA
jgi:hypothetical protein